MQVSCSDISHLHHSEVRHVWLVFLWHCPRLHLTLCLLLHGVLLLLLLLA
jgi:hypothetical protein